MYHVTIPNPQHNDSPNERITLTRCFSYDDAMVWLMSLRLEHPLLDARVEDIVGEIIARNEVEENDK